MEITAGLCPPSQRQQLRDRFLSVAIGRLFASALGGRTKERAALLGDEGEWA
jgi:hypothetical protein